jgi:pyruvate/2-oxoglutarate dehydrogenase complex dihydrolipoamide dehydrogenase (E3) component
VLLIGGSAVGTELGTFYARMGAQTTIVQRGDRLIDREDPRVGELAARALQADGITIHAARPWTYERDPRGALGLLADRDRQVLAGAWAVAPLAGEWIHQAALAIRAQVPLDILADQVAQFPTYTEAYLTALEQLAR